MHVCNIDNCGRHFSRINYLNTHKKSHSKLLKCSFCYKLFGKKYDLMIHERIHQKIKSEICTFCQMKFNDPSNLKKHIQRKHSEINQRSFVCRQCHKEFIRKESLQKHWQTHLNFDQRLLHQCKICNTSFTFKSNLLKHVKKFH